MKPFLPIVLLCLTGCSTRQLVYSNTVTHTLDQLREWKSSDPPKVPRIGGSSVGFGGDPHGFYLMYLYVNQYASEKDLTVMLQDENAAVRIMGVKCTLARQWLYLPKPDIDPLLSDRAQVEVSPLGCSVTIMTVGEVVAELKKSPSYLGD